MYLSQILNHDQLKRTFLPGYQVSIIKFQCVTKLETTPSLKLEKTYINAEYIETEY